VLDVPHEVAEHVSWLVYARRCELNSRWRRLDCFRQALLVLAHLRKNETLARVAAGFGVSTATAGRYVSEAVDILAERAPSLHEALRELPPEGSVILDSTLIATDRNAADEPPYSTRDERARRGRPGRDTAVVLASVARPHARPDRSPRTRCDPSLSVPSAPRRCRPSLPRSRSHRPHPLLRPRPSREIRPAQRHHARLRAPGERAYAHLKTVSYMVS
jgi:hypothetical protein